MPIYEYLCEQCEDRSEALQRLNDAPLSECGKCGGKLRKLVSAPAFQLKGTGWYVTDYAKKDSGGKSDKSSESSSGSSSSTSSDSSSESSSESSSSESSSSPSAKDSGSKEKSA